MTTDFRRRPPAYQEYGSDLLSLESVREMTLAERGLFVTMRWYAWANDTLPGDADRLAMVLGLREDEVRAALTTRVLGFFRRAEGAADRLVCPELAAQMKTLMARHEERAASGRRGGKSTQRKRNQPQAELEAPLKLTEKRRDEKSRDEKSRDELSKEGDEFLQGMEAEERRQREEADARPRLVVGGKGQQ